MMRVFGPRKFATSSIGFTVAESPMRCGRLFDQGIQARQRQRQMRAALIVRHGVDLVHNHGAGGAQHGARLFRRHQNVERFRRGDQDVRRLPAHLLALIHAAYRRCAPRCGWARE